MGDTPIDPRNKGGRPALPARLRRTSAFNVRVRPDEFATLCRLARAAHKPMRTYARDIILRVSRANMKENDTDG